MFQLVVVVLFLFVSFLPIRPIIALWLCVKFGYGTQYHRKKFRNNLEVGRIELKNFFRENKMKE